METGKSIELSKISEEDKKLIESQLQIILKSSYFHSAKQMKRFLEYIVRKTLIGEGNLLKQYTIGVECLGFAENFDSDSNPSVRIMGGRVRTRLKEYYQNTDNNLIIIDIPKGTYTPKIYHSSDDKSLSIDENDEEISIYSSSGPRLALLSFTDEKQGNTSNQLLLQTADVLAEEFSRFILFNFTVSNPYGDKSESKAVGDNVDADYILALFIQDLPNKHYELICRLTKTSSKEVIWSEIYKLNNEKSVVDQGNVIRKIIAATADVQQGKLHAHWARSLLLNKANIPDEYKPLVYFRHYYDNLNAETFADTVSICETMLAKNPNDIIANIVYSDICRRDYAFAYDLIENSLDKGIECAQRVTHLRPDAHEAHFTLGQLYFSKGDWERSEEEFNNSRKITSMHAVFEYVFGYHLCLMGKWDEGLQLSNKVIELSNSQPSLYYTVNFWYLYNQEKYKEALVEAKKIAAPNIAYGPLARCISYVHLEDITKAKNELNCLIKSIPDLTENGKEKLLRMFVNEDLVEKMWNDLQIAMED